MKGDDEGGGDAGNTGPVRRLAEGLDGASESTTKQPPTPTQLSPRPSNRVRPVVPLVQLHTRMMAGDEVAAQYLLDRVYREAYSPARRVLRNDHDAKDVASEVFEKFYERPSLFPDPEDEAAFLAYIRTTAQNRAVSVARKRKMHNLRITRFSEDQISLNQSAYGADALLAMLQSEVLAMVRNCLTKHPSDHVNHFLSEYVEDRSGEDVAKEAGVTPITLRVRHHRLRRALKRCTERLLNE